MSNPNGKVFVGGLSWETTDEKPRRYFENYGVVQEAFVSYDKGTGRPRGFGFVVFADPVVADKVVAQQHTIDRREVEAKRALPKEESPISKDQKAAAAGQRTQKIFVGGLAPSVDETVFRAYFEEFGTVEDAVVMFDHENRRSRGFGFITFAEEEAVEKVFANGTMQTIHDKQIEIKRAVPRDSMLPSPRPMYRPSQHFYDGQSPYRYGPSPHHHPHHPPHPHHHIHPPHPHHHRHHYGGPHHPPLGGRGDGSRISPGVRAMYSPPPMVVTGIPANMAGTSIPPADVLAPRPSSLHSPIVTMPSPQTSTSTGGGTGRMGVGATPSPVPVSPVLQGTPPSTSTLVGAFGGLQQNGISTPGAGGYAGSPPPFSAAALDAVQQTTLQQQVGLASAIEQLHISQDQPATQSTTPGQAGQQPSTAQQSSQQGATIWN